MITMTNAKNEEGKPPVVDTKAQVVDTNVPTGVTTPPTKAPEAVLVNAPKADHVLAESGVDKGSAAAEAGTAAVEAGLAAAVETSKAVDDAIANGDEITYRVIKIGNVMSVSPKAEVLHEGLSFEEANEKIVGERNMFVEAEV
jgi:hypothetical protein